MPTENPYPGPSFRDWALLAVGLALVIAGFLVLPSDRVTGGLGIVFFGLCAGLAAAAIARKLRYRRQHATRVEVVGGVPIRPSRARAVVVAAALLLPGFLAARFGPASRPFFLPLAWLVAALGCLILLGVALGRLPAGYLQFDPLGVTLARRRWKMVVPWDCILQVAAGEVHDNPVLLLWVNAEGSVRVEPPEHREAMLKELAANRRWLGADISLLTSPYRIDLPLLVQAIERYVSDPASRSELARRRLEPQEGAR